MACKDAVVENLVAATPDMCVSEVFEILNDKAIRMVPVVEGGKLLGMFGFNQILKALLPVSVTMKDGLESLDFVIGTAPGVAKRLRKLKEKSMGEVMDKDYIFLLGDTPTWEAVRLLSKHGSPIPVINNKKDRHLLGIVSEQSVLNDLEGVIKEMEEEGFFDNNGEEDT